jgi:hypothetical protein
MVACRVIHFDVAIIECGQARPSVEYGGISVLAQ